MSFTGQCHSPPGIGGGHWRLAEAIRRALPDAERGQVRKTVELLDHLAEAMDEGLAP